MSWDAIERAEALERVAGMAERGVPWIAGLDALQEEHGAGRLGAASRAAREGQPPGAVLEAAGLISAETRALLDRQQGDLPSGLRHLARDARDEARIRQALRQALTAPSVRLVATCAAAGTVWGISQGAASTWSGGGLMGSLALLLLLLAAVALCWTLPVVLGWCAWTLGIGRAPIEGVLRWLPSVGEVVSLAGAARFWSTLGLGLKLEQPLPVVLRAARDAFPRGSLSRREVEALLPPALEGSELSSLIAGVDNPRLRDEQLLRVAQQRGSLADDVLALAELRREQLLDAARYNGAAILVFAEAGLFVANAAMLIFTLFGSLGGGAFSQLQQLQ